METMPLKFLVVEDEAILAMDIEAMIAEAGHTVVGEVASAAAFHKLTDDLQPDIALVDIQLAGGSSGIEVSQAIQHRWPSTVVVFVTANPSKIPEDFAGAYGVVGKPFSHGSFMSVLEYVCDGVRDPPRGLRKPEHLAISPKAMAAWS